MSDEIDGRPDRLPGSPSESFSDQAASEGPSSSRELSVPESADADQRLLSVSRGEDRESPPLARFARQVPEEVVGLWAVRRDCRDRCYLQIGPSSTIFDLDEDPARARVMKACASVGKFPKASELDEVIEGLRSAARLKPASAEVWVRVAQLPDRVVLDVGDDSDTRIEVSAKGVRVIRGLASPLFVRPPAMQALTIPAESGDLNLLDRYVDLPAFDTLIVKAYLSYVVSHGKCEGTSFPILVVGGGQGSGKSVLCRIIQQILDPSGGGIQAFPRQILDLVITLQNCHLAVFDNVRSVAPVVSDHLCVAVTGGTVQVRRLYTNAGQYRHHLHGAIAINGVHWFIGEPDLAQRCIYLELPSRDSSNRRSERDLLQEFRSDLPVIFRGLLDLVSQILAVLPEVKPSAPERLYEFSAWMAAMEKVHGVPEGVYQSAYSHNVCEGMRDALLEDPVAEALTELVSGPRQSWSGTPAELLGDLTELASRRTLYSREWPGTASALSKRARSLEAGLARQGISIRFTRGRERRITITRQQEADHD